MATADELVRHQLKQAEMAARRGTGGRTIVDMGANMTTTTSFAPGDVLTVGDVRAMEEVLSRDLRTVQEQAAESAMARWMGGTVTVTDDTMGRKADIRVGPEPDLVSEMLKVEDVPEDYEALAAKLGLSPKVYFDSYFKRLLQKLEICVYPEKQVSGYMDWITKKEMAERIKNGQMRIGERLRWGWKPLREKDASGVPRGPYDKPVPMQALRIVERITAETDQCTFWVTDYEVERPDPFLAAKTPNGNRYVLYHWDEPSFVVE